MGPSWDFRGTLMGPSWDLHGTLMRPACDPHGTFMGPSCDLQRSLIMEPPLALPASLRKVFKCLEGFRNLHETLMGPSGVPRGTRMGPSWNLLETLMGPSWNLHGRPPYFAKGFQRFSKLSGTFRSWDLHGTLVGLSWGVSMESHGVSMETPWGGFAYKPYGKAWFLILNGDSMETPWRLHGAFLLIKLMEKHSF